MERYRNLSPVVAEHPWLDMWLLEDGRWVWMYDYPPVAGRPPIARNVPGPYGETEE